MILLLNILNQNYKDIELIVIYDGSTDDSIKLINDNFSKDQVKVVKKLNAGQLSTFNESLNHYTGDIICLLDADDKYKKDYISEIVKVYKENKDVNFRT